MNIREFKAWLEGFEEAMEGKPTQAQWKKIKQKLSEIEDGQVKEYHYYRHLYPLTYTDYGWRQNQIYCGTAQTTVSGSPSLYMFQNGQPSWYEQGKQEAVS